MNIDKEWKANEFSKGYWELNCAVKCLVEHGTEDIKGNRIHAHTHCYRCNKIAPKEVIVKFRLLGFK